MRLIINGESREVSEAATVARLLEMLSLQPEATVVERNGEIVERAAYPDTTLAEGDTVELVRFVGGG